MKKIYLIFFALLALTSCNNINNLASNQASIEKNATIDQISSEESSNKYDKKKEHTQEEDNKKSATSTNTKNEIENIEGINNSYDSNQQTTSVSSDKQELETETKEDKKDVYKDNKDTSTVSIEKNVDDTLKQTDKKEDKPVANNIDKSINSKESKTKESKKIDNKDDTYIEKDSKDAEKPKDKQINTNDDQSKADGESIREKETPIIDDKEEDQTNQDEILNPESIYVGKKNVAYLNLGISNYDIEKTQSYIDMGNIIATVTKFDPHDNEITYFAGHTYNFKGVSTLKVGTIVTVTDSQGIGYKYKIIDWAKYPAGVVENEAPFIGGYHLSQLAGDGIGVESIVVQYCDDNDVPMIFFGLPV